ncbi:MAG TPA: TolC family protein [Chitinophagaceae bacterium]|nr:TolC family protein [Chitinophagaceae bacterium]
MKKFFFLLVILLTGLLGSAQQLLTLEEAIATALKNNYDIQLSRNDSMVAALDYSFRNSVFLPRLNASTTLTWNDNDQKQEFSTGVIRKGEVKTNNFNNSLSLNWTLFDGFKMFATREKAEEFIRLGELGIKNQVITTVATVINTYYNIVRQKQQLRANEELLSISQTRVTLAERRLDIGVGTKPDVLQSKVDMNAQKAAQLEQQTLITQLKEQLNQVMNVTGIPSYDVADSIPVDKALVLGDIQNAMANGNPALLIARKNIDIAAITLKERRAERLPVVSFNSAYNFNRSDNTLALNPALPLFTSNRGFNYGIGITLPIINNHTTKRLIAQAKLDIQYQELLYNSQKSQLDLAVMNAFQEYEQQKKALILEEENILLARENVNIALEVYRLGASTIIQLREAQISLEDAYNRLIAARYNTKLAETELLRLKGDLVK